MGNWFIYGWFSSKQKAEDWLEHMFAVGELSSGEKWKISGKGKTWMLMLEALP